MSVVRIRDTEPPDESWDEEVTVDGEEVVVGRIADEAGWAVFSGCEGETPDFIAFFAGPGGKALAEALVEAKTPDGEKVVFDGACGPAVLESALGLPGGLFASNHYDEEIGIKALCVKFAVWSAEDFRGEKT